MEFSAAVREMEAGKEVMLPRWKGRLFMDHSGNVLHIGACGGMERGWMLDIGRDDWEVCVMSKEDGIRLRKSPDMVGQLEKKVARIESLFESNSEFRLRVSKMEQTVDRCRKESGDVVASVEMLKNRLDAMHDSFRTVFGVIETLSALFTGRAAKLKSAAPDVEKKAQAYLRKGKEDAGRKTVGRILDADSEE